MGENRRYEVEVEMYNQNSKQFTVIDNYWDNSDYAFYDMTTHQLFSYSSTAVEFVRKSFKGFEGLFSTIYPGRYCIYTNGIHGNTVKIVRV